MEAGGVLSMIHGFRKDPRLLASTLSLQKPERMIALLMAMTVCVLIDAALSSRPVSLLQSCGRGCCVLLCGAHRWS